jgi:hypothetical protein
MTVRLVCPKCHTAERLYSTEQATIDYPVAPTVDSEGQVELNYTGEDTRTYDEGSQYQGEFWCSACSEQWAEANLERVAQSDGTGQAEPMTERNWTGVIALEGEQTDDGRLLAPGSLTWDALPLPLQQRSGADKSAELVGTIEAIERVGSEIHASGRIRGRESGQTASIGIEVDAASWDATIHRDGPSLQRLVSGRLRAAMVDGAPAWGDRVSITVE